MHVSPQHLQWALALVGAVWLISGAAFADEVVAAAGSVTVTKTTFRGWEDCYLMTNGQLELVVVPQIARIMKLSIVGDENVLWVNDELTPDETGEQAPAAVEGQWLNYGGYKLWPAPEKDWRWPPDWDLDAGPCKVEVTPECTLRLIGRPSEKHGLRFDREIRLDQDNAMAQITQTAVNVSDVAVVASIWEVTQVKADCIGFVPIGPGATYRTGDGGQPDHQWSMVDDFLLVKPDGTTGKVFVTGPPGMLGCKRGNTMYLKTFDIPAVAPPEPETPREVYTGNLGYTELEVVGPAVTLQPGESTSTSERWYLMPLEKGEMPDETLVQGAKRIYGRVRRSELEE